MRSENSYDAASISCAWHDSIDAANDRKRIHLQTLQDRNPQAGRIAENDFNAAVASSVCDEKMDGGIRSHFAKR